MEERLPNVCFSDHGMERHVLHAGEGRSLLQGILLFINGESAATLPHLTYQSGCSWDDFLALPMHCNDLRRASQILHRKALGSIRFT